MSSMRDFFDSTRSEPNARVSASSRGSFGFSILLLAGPTETIGRGASSGATCTGLLSSSFFFGFFPIFSSLSLSRLRFSLRFSLSVSGSFGSKLSCTSLISPPLPSLPESSPSIPLILSSVEPMFWKMSWLNHLAARCSALNTSSPASSTGTSAVSEAALGCTPSFSGSCSASLLARPPDSTPNGLGGPSARASRASPSGPGSASSSSAGALRASWNLRRAFRSSLSGSSSSSSSSSLSRSMCSSAACLSIAWLNSLSSPAHAAMTRWRRVSFLRFRMRCICVRNLSSLRILRSSWSTARSTSSRASLSNPLESLSLCAPALLEVSPPLSSARGSMYASWSSKA
mmetsp:Transcript_75536/g.208403  ORF Transcript_75536/g.208403 Transcript_75536/m.208403 type:complete len:344 (-) Transcript_75536:1514-2545(-)